MEIPPPPPSRVREGEGFLFDYLPRAAAPASPLPWAAIFCPVGTFRIRETFHAKDKSEPIRGPAVAQAMAGRRGRKTRRDASSEGMEDGFVGDSPLRPNTLVGVIGFAG